MNEPVTTPVPATPPRKRRYAAVFLVALMAVGVTSVTAAAWFQNETVQGTGQVVKQDRAVRGFKGVGLALPAQVEVRQGATEGVTVEAEANLLPLIETVVEKGKLQIRAVRKDLNIKSSHLRIVVNAKDIDELAIGGSGRIAAPQLKAAKLELDIGGSGTIDLAQVQADDIDASIGGSGDIRIAGIARKFAVSIAGSGEVRAPQLKAEQAEVSIAGSGSATLWPVKSLEVAIAGSGDVDYYGDPVARLKVAGSGKIKRIGSNPQ